MTQLLIQHLIKNGAFLSSDGYQLIGSSGIYTLKNSSGVTYSDDSTPGWDVTAAKETASGFEVLFEGSDGSYKEEPTLYGQQILLV